MLFISMHFHICILRKFVLEIASCLLMKMKQSIDHLRLSSKLPVILSSPVMLCTFHGVWMAFKKDLLTLLEDCDCGSIYGTLVSCCINLYIRTRISKFFCIILYSFLYSIHIRIYRGVVIQVIHASSVCI